MLTRRTLLGGGITLAGTAAVVGLSGCTAAGSTPGSRERPRCVTRGSLERSEALAGSRLVYEEGGAPQPFAMEPAFAERMAAWLGWWNEHSGEPAPEEVWSFGTWIDGTGSCDSWHHAGRAFDVTSLRRGGSVTFSGRMDRIEELPEAEQGPVRRRYWRLAAGLNLYFADVLTHLFDEAHRNHIHVDNGRSGTGLSRFTGRSRIQTLSVQAVCAEVWAIPTKLSGRWDRATRRSVDLVLEQTGARGDLTTSDVWQHFLTVSVQRSD